MGGKSNFTPTKRGEVLAGGEGTMPFEVILAWNT